MRTSLILTTLLVAGAYNPGRPTSLDTSLLPLPASAPVAGYQLWGGGVASGALDSLQLSTATDGPGPALSVYRVQWETAEGVPLCSVELDCALPAGAVAVTECGVELVPGGVYWARVYSFCTGGTLPAGTATAVFRWQQ